MALFFDHVWFEGKLAERGLSRDVLAAAASLSAADLALVFKDQKELSAGQVAAFAELLGVTAAEVADRAGVTTPRPGPALGPMLGFDARIEALERRVAMLESKIAGPTSG